MELIEQVVLSIVQGITEWLPISSEGVSVYILTNFFNSSPSQAVSYAIFLHIGTMLAVVARFRREFIKILRLEDKKLLKLLLVTTIFTAITAIPLFYLITSFRSGLEVTLFIGLMLIVTGIILRLPKGGYKNFESMGVIDMALLGLFQGFAILPGISRSGTTISFLLLRKINKEDALKVSFLISVPAVLGALTLDFLSNTNNIQVTAGLLIAAITFVVGYTTMDLLLKFAKVVDFSKFCISLGLITIIVSSIQLV